jgi:hypothetical protein
MLADCLCGCSSSFSTRSSFSEGQAIPWMPENSLGRGPALPMTPGTLPSVPGGKELPRDPEGALCYPPDGPALMFPIVRSEVQP